MFGHSVLKVLDGGILTTNARNKIVQAIKREILLHTTQLARGQYETVVLRVLEVYPNLMGRYRDGTVSKVSK